MKLSKFGWAQSSAIYSVVFGFLLPMSFLRFLLRLKDLTGLLWKTFFRDLLTGSMFQSFWISLLMFGKNWLYVIAKGMRVVIGLSFLLPRSYQVSQLF